MDLESPLFHETDLQIAIVRDPLTVRPDTSVMSVIGLMSGVRVMCANNGTHSKPIDDLHLEARSSCVMIVQDQHLLGIFTERDVVRLSAQQCNLDQTQIQEVMIHPVISIREEAFIDLFFAINLLQTHHIRHLPVLDSQGRVVGLITNESLRQASRPIDFLRLRLVSEVMTQKVICTSGDSTMLSVAQLMAKHRISSVLIVETRTELPDQSRTIPVGILTERDIVQFQALGLNLSTCLAKTVMSSPIFSVKPDDSLWVVQQIMEQRLIRRLAVTGDHGELLGIVTQTSLLQALHPLELYNLAEVLENKLTHLEAEKLALLENRAIELEREVAARTQALREKAEREQLVSTLATQIRSSLSLQAILEMTVGKVRELLNCHRANIWQVEKEGSLKVVAESTHSSRSLVGERIHDSILEGKHFNSYRQGRIRIISDINKADIYDCHRDMLISIESRAKILVPLLCEDTLWGFLSVSESQHAREWQPQEVELIQSIATHVTIAIQQATNHQQLQNQLIELRQTQSALKQLNLDLEQKVAERTAALQASEATIRATLETIPDLLLRLRRDGTCLEYIQPKLQADTFLPVENHLSNVLPPDLLQIQLHMIDQAITTRELQVYEHHFLKRDRLIYEEVRILAINDQEVLAIIRDISDRKKAEFKIQQQAEQVRLIGAITQRIRSYTQLDEILTATVEEIHEVLKVDRVLVLQLLPGGLGTAIAESVSAGWQQVLSMVFPKNIVPQEPKNWYLDTHNNVINTIEDGSLLSGLSGFLAELEVKTQLVIPIIQNETLWGLLVAHQCSQSRLWQDWEINLLKQISDQLAIAIQQADLFEKLKIELQERQLAEKLIRRQAEQETLLRGITQRIRKTLDLQTIFETAVQEVRQFLGADRAAIFKFHAQNHIEGGHFVSESVASNFPSVLTTAIPDHFFSIEATQAFQEGLIQVNDDINQADISHFPRQVLLQFKVRGNLVVPLLKSEGLWGLLCIHYCAKPYPWKSFEVELVKQIGTQLAIAIQQGGLFTQLQQELGDRLQAEYKLTETNQQLSLSNQELILATRLKDEFLANMSHELRTPLNAILGMSESLIEEVFGAISERQKKALELIERSGNHLLSLINDVLDVAKIESGTVALDKVATSMAELCRSSLGLIKLQAHQKRLRVNLELPNHLPDLMLDERRIRQVLINLLSNAIKFTPEEGSITVRVSQFLGPGSQDWLRVEVQDSGIGISADNLTRLFKPFMQLDSALNRKYMGTGLGLVLAKQIVELHGGRIGATSELGVGSCFTIELPCDHSIQALSEAVMAEANPEVSQEDANPSHLILLAEDNEANILTLTSYLEAKGYQLLVAKDGQEAIDLAKTHQPDLILMDIQMPGMDGLEATRQIRLDAKLIHIPIIALTALAMEGDRERCLAAGANDYLAKPVRLKDLSQIIQTLLMA